MKNLNKVKVLFFALVAVVLIGVLKDCSKPIELDSKKIVLQQGKQKQIILEKENKTIDQEIKHHYEIIDSLNAVKSVNIDRIEQATGSDLQTALDSLFN